MLPLYVIVLAAGEGKRMRSERPKVLLPLAGRPLLAYVLDCARTLDPMSINVVYGHRGEAVRSTFSSAQDVHWVHQAVQRGTGHAVHLALEDVPEQARVLVLYGDVPLLRPEVLRRLVDAHAPLVLLAAEVLDPTGYGRVVRDGLGQVRAVIEERDADAEQCGIHWVNTGILAADARRLRVWAANVRDSNAQHEFYLTDIFAQAAEEGVPGLCIEAPDAREVLGANDAVQLAELEAYFRERAALEIRECGLPIRAGSISGVAYKWGVTLKSTLMSFLRVK